MPKDQITFEADIPAGPSAAASVRRQIDPLCEHLGRHLFDDLSLLVSELVTNSSRHAGLSEGTPIHVEIHATSDSLHTEVSDPGRGFEVGRQRKNDMGSGWGLHLVDRLSERWGVQGGPRTTVWFELPLSESPA
jgi:two-component sensor histidine kinase